MQVETSGHGYSTGREIKGLSDILDKTGNIHLVVSEAAQNTLTNAQEFHWGDVFMKFKYQNKGGKLFANGRSIEDINDVNEVGGDRMDRVLSALNQMITDSSIEESIVVSEDVGYGRHFIYKYRRTEGDQIEGLAFEYQGTNGELGEVVSYLGKRAINHSDVVTRNSTDFSKPLFFHKDKKNDITDLSNAALKSFKTEERRNQMSSYINRLKRDTDDYDNLTFRRQQQEQELKKHYERLILKEENAKIGIARAVYGAINFAQNMITQEDRRREEVRQVINTPVPEMTRQDIIKSLPHDLLAIPVLHDYTEELTDQKTNDGTKAVKDQVLSRIRNEQSQLVETEYHSGLMIQPIIPGLIGLTTIISEIPSDGFTTSQNYKNQPHSGDTKQSVADVYGFDGLVFGLPSFNPNQSEHIFWREVISMIFQPVETGIENNQMLFGSQQKIVMVEDDGGLFLTQMNFGATLMEFLPIIHADVMSENSIQKNEDLTGLSDSFQKGLEVIGELLSHYFDEERDTDLKVEKKLQQKTIESDIVKLSYELAQELIRDKSLFVRLQEGEYEIKIDALAQLSFLLHAYENTNSSELVKQLLGVLIYKQIQSIQSDKKLFSQNPKLDDILKKFTELSPHTSFLDKRFELLFSSLQKILLEIANILNEMESVEGDNIGKLIFIIFQIAHLIDLKDFISNNEQAYFSNGKLQNINNHNSGMMILNQFKHRKNYKKTKYKLFPYGIIYQYRYSIA